MDQKNYHFPYCGCEKAETETVICVHPLPTPTIYIPISKLDPLLRSNGDTLLWINLKAEMQRHSENLSAPELVLEIAACHFPLMQVASLDED